MVKNLVIPIDDEKQCRPNYNKWGRKDYWSIKEAIALLHNLDPDITFKRSHELETIWCGGDKSLHEFLIENPGNSYVEYYELAKSSPEFEYSKDYNAEPLWWIEWAEKKGLSVPPELKKAVDLYHSETLVITEELKEPEPPAQIEINTNSQGDDNPAKIKKNHKGGRKRGAYYDDLLKLFRRWKKTAPASLRKSDRELARLLHGKWASEGFTSSPPESSEFRVAIKEAKKQVKQEA